MQLSHLGAATHSSSADRGYRTYTCMQYSNIKTRLLQCSATRCATEKHRCATTGAEQSRSGGASETENCSRDTTLAVSPLASGRQTDPIQSGSTDLQSHGFENAGLSE